MVTMESALVKSAREEAILALASLPDEGLFRGDSEGPVVCLVCRGGSGLTYSSLTHLRPPIGGLRVGLRMRNRRGMEGQELHEVLGEQQI